MTQGREDEAARRGRTAAAAVVALLCAWRLPRTLGLGADSTAIASHAVSVALAAGLYLLIKRALGFRDRALNRIGYGLGALFAVLTAVGGELAATGELAPLTWLGALDGLVTVLPLAMAYGAVIVLALRRVDGMAARPAREGVEPLWRRVLGNGFVAFLVMLACWIPVWLAFWPGFFNADNVTQFYGYYDNMHSAHHPLLHTQLLGGLMMLGIDNSAEGSPAVGLALYCVVQMVLLAAMLAYACAWLRRRGAPFWPRMAVLAAFAAMPFYALWPMCAHKDVLFSALVLMVALQLCDLWRDGFRLLKSPLRIGAFVVTAALMMLFRNNGVYAFVLLTPFVVLLARSKRLRVLLLCAACVAVYVGANAYLFHVTSAEPGSTVEMLSIPLQQIGRTLREQPDALDEADRALIETLYGEGDPSAIYDATLADALKWAISYDALDENLPQLLGLWVRLGLRYPLPYLEAFLVQSLPYLSPGAPMRTHLEIGVAQLELMPIEEHSFLPWLRAPYEAYNDTLMFMGLPCIRLLSDPAVFAWLSLIGLCYALCRRRRGVAAGFLFGLSVWGTCLLGPVAAIRYVLSLYYIAPVLWAALLAPPDRTAPPAREKPAANAA